MNAGSPPQIWMYWTHVPGGRDRPPYLDACLKSVQLNSGCQVTVCDETSARELIKDLPDGFEDLAPNHQSDVFRLHVLTLLGGMYMDFDTIVLRSVMPLFEKLSEFELIGATWHPRRLPEDRWEPLATAVLGPMRPNLKFMCNALEKQRRLLSEKGVNGSDRYGYGELLQWILAPCFEADPPTAWLQDGAETWFAFFGGPGLPLGNLGHALRPTAEVGDIPDSEFFALTNVLLPDEFKWAPVSKLMKTQTVLGHLLRKALGESAIAGVPINDASVENPRPSSRGRLSLRIPTRNHGSRKTEHLDNEQALRDLFDQEWYLRRYSDAGAGQDPFAHYLQAGGERDPNPLFDCNWYRSQYPEVVNGGFGAVKNYLEEGALEGRNPSPHFDSSWYLEQNPDVKTAGINPLIHYLRCGAAEQRLPNEWEENGDKLLLLYRKYVALRFAEYTDPKLASRQFLLERIPKGGVGAELGVFTGRFGYQIRKIARPALLYLVDPWWKKYGELYPDWGEYTAHGKLETRAAYEATLARSQRGNGQCRVVVGSSFDWLEALNDCSLDFVYLDSTHEYDDTLRELSLIAKKLKPNGIILGDDWIADPEHMHYGVFKAVHEFVATSEFRVILAGVRDQWMLKRFP